MTDDRCSFGLIFPFIFNLPGQLGETLVHVISWFRTDFKKLHIMFFGQSISLLIGDLSFLIEVTFSCYQYFADIFWRIVIYLLYPSCNVAKGSAVSNRIGEYDPCSSFIVGLSNISESLLTSSIPYLHFDSLLIDLKHLDFKVDSNSSNIVFLKDSLTKIGE